MLAGGALVCLRAKVLSKSCAMRCTFIPTPTMPARANLMVSGLVAFNMNMAAALPGRNVF